MAGSKASNSGAVSACRRIFISSTCPKPPAVRERVDIAKTSNRCKSGAVRRVPLEMATLFLDDMVERDEGIEAHLTNFGAAVGKQDGFKLSKHYLPEKVTVLKEHAGKPSRLPVVGEQVGKNLLASL